MYIPIANPFLVTTKLYFVVLLMMRLFPCYISNKNDLLFADVFRQMDSFYLFLSSKSYAVIIKLIDKKKYVVTTTHLQRS